MAFRGTVTSDFMKLISADDADKRNYINFAATDFLSLRDSLLRYVQAVYPLDYTYFSESDFGMMLIELVAYMGHVLSYKADYLANENFLKTAKSRESIKNLMQLIGVRMRGPIAAAADAKLSLPFTWADSANSFITIAPENRVVTITSPEDGLPLTYTLYKVAADGDIDTANSNASLIIYNSDKTGSVTTFSSLVLLEGSLVVEQGTFSDTESLKSVRLQQAPIVEGSLQVVITGESATSGEYVQVDNIFYASGPSQKVFQLLSNEDYGGTIVFGDNNIGKTPSIGDQYTILYRVGGGSRGNIRKSVLNAPISLTFEDGGSPVSYQATVQNTSIGTGGSDAETAENAKRYGPLMFRTQNRLVTLNDYKAFVNSYISSYGSIGKATAVTRRAYSSANIIDLYVLEKANNLQLRKATPEYKRQILLAIDDKKMLTDEVVVVDGLIRTLDLQITLRLDKKYQFNEGTIRQKVRNAIEAFFNMDNNDFGKVFNPQDLMYSIFQVEEVRFATIDNVPEAIQVNFNEIVQLNNYTLNIVYV
jgi:hypothetical protein